MKYFSLIGLFFLFSCASNNSFTQQQLNFLDTLISSKSFEIQSNYAQPQMTSALMSVQNSGLFFPDNNLNNKYIAGTSNYFRMKGDTISASLPYFGEQRMGGSYNSNEIGVDFEGIPKKMIFKKGKNNSSEIKFTINDKNKRMETYNVVVQIFPNLNSTIRINSSHRTSIQYTGKAKKTKRI